MKKLNSSGFRLFLLSVAAALTLLLPSAALADGEPVLLCSVAKGSKVHFVPNSGELGDQVLFIGGTVGSRMSRKLTETIHEEYSVTENEVTRATYQKGRGMWSETITQISTVTNGGNTYVCAPFRLVEANSGTDIPSNSTGWIQTIEGKALYAAEAGAAGFIFTPFGNVDPYYDPDNPTSKSPVRFSPSGGTYGQDQTVSLSCNEGWSILYTTDGSNPGYRNIGSNSLISDYELYGNQYSGPITVTEDTTIKAAAYYIEESNINRGVKGFSSIVEQTYHMTNPSTVTVGAVTFSPVGNSYTEAQTVTLSCPEGWSILYTTDGSNPRYENTEFYTYKLYGQQYSGPIPVTQSTVIKAAAYYIGDDVIRRVEGFSAVGVQTYYIFNEESCTVGNLNFSPAGGNFTEAQTVTLSCLSECDGILYTTDGSQPGYADDWHIIDNVNGTRYSGPITVSDRAVIRAVAYKENRMDEFGNLQDENPYTFYDIVEQTYYIINDEPGTVTVGSVNFSPEGGTFTGPQTVTLTGWGEWDGILYTTDGSQPGYREGVHVMANMNGTHYSGPITVSESTVIRAVAYKENGGFQPEDPYTFYDVGEQTYYIVNDEPGTVTLGLINFSPEGGIYSEPQAVTLTGMSGWDGIFYTTDGSDPGWPEGYVHVMASINGTHYSDPITVSGSTVIKAVAYKENRDQFGALPPENPYTFHDVAAQTYTILTSGLSITAPAFDPVPEGYARPEAKPITLVSTGTGAATIATVTLTGTGADCFTLNTADGTIIAAGAADGSTYTVQPVAGLEPGIYTATLTAYYDYGAKATAEVTFSVLAPALAAGENAVSFEAVYKEQIFRFIPEETGAYRFRCESESVYPAISVLDGSTPVVFVDQSPLLTGFNCAAELEGGTTYTVRLESLNGTGSISVLIQSTALYQICKNPAMAHGSVFVEQGGVPVSDAGVIATAYAGSDVFLYPEAEEGYGLAELRILNSGEETVSTGTFFVMPADDVTVCARFETAYTLSYEGDDHMMFYGVRIDGLGLGDSGGCEVFAGQQVAIDWNFMGDYAADSFSVTAGDNAAVAYEITSNENTNMNSLTFTMPGENVHVTMTSRPVGFDDAAFTLPMGTQSIEESAFEGDTSITSVVVPQGCRSIGKWAFRGCTNLERISIPAGCTVGEDAFDGCSWVYLYSAADSPAADYCAAHDNCELMPE